MLRLSCVFLGVAVHSRQQQYPERDCAHEAELEFALLVLFRIQQQHQGARWAQVRGPNGPYAQFAVYALVGD